MEAVRKITKQGKISFGPSGAPVWSTPAVDAKRGLLYVTTGDNYSSPATETSDAVIALHMGTGQIVWSKQVTANDTYNGSCSSSAPNCGPDFDFGSSAMLVAISGRDLLIAGQKSGVVYAFDPDEMGKIVWQVRVGKGGAIGGVQWGMTSDGGHVYAAAADVVLRQSGLGIKAPVGNADFDPVQGGGLTALRFDTRRRLFWLPGWAHPSVFDRRWPCPLGLRYVARLSDRKQHSCARRFTGRCWTCDSRWHALCEFRLPALRRNARQRVARFLVGRQVANHLRCYSRMVDGQCGSNSGRPDRFITTGLPTIQQGCGITGRRLVASPSRADDDPCCPHRNG